MKTRRYAIRLNSRGITHLAVPLMIITIVAIGGVYMLVRSSALSVPGQDPNPGVPTQGSSPGVPSQGSGKPKAKQKPPKTTPATSRTPQANPTSGSNGSQTGGDDGPAVTTGASSGTITITNPPSSKASFTPKPKPSGDIIVLTYINDPEIDKKGDKDHRIGGFKVKVERQGGQNLCDNTKKSTGVTNKTKKLTPKGEKKPVLVHGTVHFLNCDAGEYKVTLMKPYRSGYQPDGPTVRKFTLKDNETEAPYFVVKKVDKKKSTTSTSGQTNTTGGTPAPN